ncbi:hypothetical protein [Deinococcus radiodurans]|uniref:Uncharacterized protein n=1 Tax=Deinococcus radiodurans (strain ATCC 13939 / DSM 20539 / JCM 16871 / CCUG 27074 / LMG 4051 / NBRC 15346 / NCIMB 9279 / VKM B-1422 / R1) TaxID=243230 RepID=Q9RZ49_DEIRA|nr:hypothetical protein [Deinococcus radiodurans]AAF12330.1 hypothetical protein DR_A0105 [Deinococcus radiodurans R1 = ATCC 13939 = DSM 20539]
MSDFHIGDNNAVRFAIVPKGTSARPATAAFFSLPNVTTSDAPISASSVTKKYYKTNGGTATRGTGATVTFTVSGDLPQDKALREPVYRLRKAILNGDQIYLERAFDEEAPAAEWEGVRLPDERGAAQPLGQRHHLQLHGGHLRRAEGAASGRSRRPQRPRRLNVPLFALARRNGEPVALITGAHRDGGRLYAGLLVVQAGLTRRRWTFQDTETKEKLVLELPKDALHLKRGANTARVWLEVYDR